MAHLAFSSPGSLIYNIGWYLFLSLIWWINWHYRFSEETDSNGHKRFPSFWSWWLTDNNDFSIIWPISNWVVLLCGIYAFLRVNVTIIYGFYTP